MVVVVACHSLVVGLSIAWYCNIAVIVTAILATDAMVIITYG